MFLLRSLLLTTLCGFLAVAAADPLKLNEVLPEGSQYGLYVQQLDDSRRVVQQHNADLLLPPASTLKILTALAARLVLEPDFRYTTEVSQAGDDLVIRFSGDPTLGRGNLKQLLQKSKAALAGQRPRDVWIDDTAFNGRLRGLGWPWENLGHCYSAPIGAVSVDDNCVPVAVYTDRKPGDKVRVNLAAHQPLRFEVDAEVVTVQQKLQQRCDLDLRPSQDNQYQISGCWPVSKTPLALKVAVQNPSLFARDIIADLLAKEGLKPRGKVRIGRSPTASGKVLAVHRSPPLPELIKHMLHRSDNQHADALLKTLGGRHFQLPGSYRTGLTALRQVLKDKADIDLGNAIIEDGSGLSRSNRITARQLGQVLDYIYRNDQQLGLLGLLPVSGESGTLRYRRSLSKPPLKGRYQAKTGTLFGTKNLAGIFTSAKGTPLVVAQIITNYFPSRKRKGPKPYIRFEQRLYNSLYSDY